MNILAISQVYWPDTASVAQHLTDVLEVLAARGHHVTVITSKNNYENPKIKYNPEEMHRNVKIIRVPASGFGKGTKVRRMLDFSSFNLMLALKLIYFPSKKYDVVIGLTSPPLISYIGAVYSRFRGKKFIYWTMDLQPELSIIANYIKMNSRAAKSLQKKGDYIFRHSALIIVLDRYMQAHIYNRIQRKDGIKVIPVWPIMNQVYDGSREQNSFRRDNNFSDKIVVMYSGNHSVMHPIDTLLNAAVALKNDSRFLFVHIGGGVRLKDVEACKTDNKLLNLIILPYQPRNKIHLSLGSADIQVVSLGDGCVGYTHPNKIYGAMFVGKPILYIGPPNSHVTDILDNCNGNISVHHGETERLVSKIVTFAETSQTKRDLIGRENRQYAETHFNPSILIDNMIKSIESI